MVGDVIVNINGEDIASMDDFQRVAQKLSSGQIVRIKVLRGNTRIFTAFRIP
jgi:S1-C subfamily serine protease